MASSVSSTSSRSGRPRTQGSRSEAFPNLALLAGTVTHPPELRVLAEGTTVASFSVRAERARVAGPTAKSASTDTPKAPGDTPKAPGAWSTPVRWVNPPAWIAELEEGTSVCGYGQVVQRFFRAAGATVRRTEVSVCDLAVVGDHRAMRRVRTAARQELAELLE